MSEITVLTPTFHEEAEIISTISNKNTYGDDSKINFIDSQQAEAIQSPKDHNITSIDEEEDDEDDEYSEHQQPLSLYLAKKTSETHKQAEQHPFILEFIQGKIPKEVYCYYLILLYSIYE